MAYKMAQSCEMQVSYRVPASPEDPASYVTYQSPFHRIEQKRAPAFKWVSQNEIPKGFLDEFIDKVNQVLADQEDDEALHLVLHEVPRLPDAEVVILDFVMFHKGGPNHFPRHQTKIHLAYEYDKNGKFIMEASPYEEV